ncbi:DUF4491 family protein [Clostridium botulinum]|nr:DUF4491 family protein [Clostridium botulinum]
MLELFQQKERVKKGGSLKTKN